MAKYLDQQILLIVQDGQGIEQGCDGVLTLDSGPLFFSRLKRMSVGIFRIWRTVRREKPSIVHFHDPELIPLGLALRVTGVKVVYDVHEDVPRQTLGKEWIPKPVRRPVAWLAEMSEWVAGRALNGVVAATPSIARRFPEKKTVIVQNFPILSELVMPHPVPYAKRSPHFAYVGGVTPIRGAKEMVEGVSKTAHPEARLQIGGNVLPPGLEEQLKKADVGGRVSFLGWVNRSQVAELLGSVRAGLVLFHHAPNHTNAQPNKLFEYMAASLPVIASHFPLWREIIDGVGCGLLVDPEDSEAIARAMDWLLDNPEEAEAMGQRGREAVERIYNWESESGTLVRFYREKLGV